MIHKALTLLDQLIATPSVSRDEEAASRIVEQFLADNGAAPNRLGNNIWATGASFDPAKPTLLLNSHIDTVKPSPSYTRDPFTPCHEGDTIYGLGSNDAGASVVSLAATFCLMRDKVLPVNLLLALTAEEEVMGENGMRAFLPEMQRRGIAIDMAIVGEPTGMQPAVGERGLVVLDGIAHGRSGHAARGEGINALYIALDDIATLRAYAFPKVSPVLGDIKVSVTQISAGTQHNVVPDTCRFVVDLRTTDAYTNEETVAMLQAAVRSELTPRSTRIRASVIDRDHPLVRASVALGGTPYVSPTTSDMALMHDFPSLKIGPGDSARSHTADEYIHRGEIAFAIDTYTQLISSLKL